MHMVRPGVSSPSLLCAHISTQCTSGLQSELNTGVTLPAVCVYIYTAVWSSILNLISVLSQSSHCNSTCDGFHNCHMR